jgi:hypothetical protein
MSPTELVAHTGISPRTYEHRFRSTVAIAEAPPRVADRGEAGRSGGDQTVVEA